MKALFLIGTVIAVYLFNSFIEWEERSYQLKVSSVPVDAKLKKAETLFALRSIKQRKLIQAQIPDNYTKKRKRYGV